MSGQNELQNGLGRRGNVRPHLQTVLRCHCASQAIGSTPHEILCGQMKTAVTGEGNAEGIVYNRSLIDLARNFGFHPKACQAYRAKTKGKVERPFRYIRSDTSGRISSVRISS